MTGTEIRMRCVEAAALVRFTDGEKLVRFAAKLEDYVNAADKAEAPKRKGRPPKADKEQSPA